MLATFLQAIELITSNDIQLEELITIDELKKFSSSKYDRKDGNKQKTVEEYFKIDIHIALAQINLKLQETQTSARTISVWTFLHEIERIYNAKISRSQHDAHELTQLINETLETENIVCNEILKRLYMHPKVNASSSGELYLLFPEFPFAGLTLSQMKCLKCLQVSKPNITPFLMLTLHPPQEMSSDLETLLEENESETITEYHCLKCRISKILEHEKHLAKLGQSPPQEIEHFLTEIADLNAKEQLFINEDVDPKLESFITNYKRQGLDISTHTSTVFRLTHILKPPKIFGIHLSRSAFNGVTISRNPCRISFKDKLSLSIDENYVKDLQKFGQATEGKHKVTQSKVLTTDVEDMEDENVQVEDVDETYPYEEPNDQALDDDDVSTTTDSDSSSLFSSDSPLGALQSTTEFLNSAPISEDQTMELVNHFTDFKFSENNVYKYRLKAVVRHQGSHIQGHYECYKRKPLFVKDSDGNIIKLSPEIDKTYITDAKTLQGMSATESRKLSQSSRDLQDTIDSERGNLRRKFSMIMSRRPSVFQADPEAANLQEIIKSGLATPAEVLVDDTDYFRPIDHQDIQKHLERSNAAPKHDKSRVRLKKLASLIKLPFWRVGDASVSEVSKSAVLFETTSVYMLYFERIDRRQAGITRSHSRDDRG